MKNSPKEKTLNALKATYCRLRASKIEGVGVFAIRDIPKGKNPFDGTRQPQWHKFSMQEFKRLDKEILRMVDDFFVIEEDNSVYIPDFGLNGMDMSFYVNNSKKPNLKIAGDGDKEPISFRADRKIKKGEELTVAYSTYDYKYE